MPGVLGGLAGIIASAVATEDLYGVSLGLVFPARAPSNTSIASLLGVPPGMDRDASSQAAFQTYQLLLSLGLGLFGGIFSGFIVKHGFCEPLSKQKLLFIDDVFFHLPHSNAPEIINLEKVKKSAKRNKDVSSEEKYENKSSENKSSEKNSNDNDKIVDSD